MAISAGKLMNVSDKKKTQSQPKAALVPTKGSQYSVGSQPAGADGGGEDAGGAEDELTNNLIIIQEKTISIDEHLRNVYKVQKKDIRDQRYEAVKEKKKNALGLMQKSAKDSKEAAGKMMGGFFSKEVDAVKNYALNIFLGFIALKLVPLLPGIIKFIAKAGPVFEWIEKTAGFLLNMLATFIDIGYKAVDTVKGVVTKVFGEGGAKQFDKFTGIFTKFMNLAMILMMATAGGPDFGRKPGGKPGKPGRWGNKFKKTKLGRKLRKLKARKLKLTRKISKRFKKLSPKRLLKRGGKFFGKQVGRFNKFVGKGVKGALSFGRRFIGKGAGAAKGLAGKAAGKIGGFAVKIFGKAAKFIAPAMKSAKPFVSKFFGRIPIIGPVVVGLVSVISGEPLGKALFKTLGAALGGALGSFIPIPVLGTLIGEAIGVFVGDLLYEGLMGKGWGAAGKKLLGSLKKIFTAGKAVVQWLGGGFKRYIENFLKETAIDIPEGGGRHTGMTLVAKALGLFDWLKGLGYVNSEGRVSKFPNLLQLYNPFKTIPLLIKSFFPPKDKSGDIGVAGDSGGGGDSYNLMDEVDESKGEKKKTKLEKKNEEIAELKKKLKEVEKSKIKEIVFKVNRVGEVAADTEAISETPGYDKSGKVKVIAMTKIKNTVVGMPEGGNTNIDIPTSSNVESGMEAALS